MVLSALLLVSAAAAAAYRTTLPPSLREQALVLRGEVGELRGEIHKCQSSLQADEVDFRGFQTNVDSLQEQIRGFESLHPEGVPVDSYPRYMKTVEEFNAALPQWSELSDSLEVAWERCRALTQHHNRLADSLATLVTEILGENPASSRPRPTLDWPSPSTGF
ncbi:MAG: hypothetical protein WEA09_12090 [Gemmatimonadota bacterium]